MKLTRIFLTALLLLSGLYLHAAISNKVTEKVRVAGSAEACKAGIESAAYMRNTAEATWDAATGTALISYDSRKTTLDVILRKIALAGYDNARYLAPDEAYAKLTDCRYPRLVKPAPVASPAVLNAPAGDPLTPVFDAYFALKNALIAADAKAAAAQAATLSKAVKAVNMNELSHASHEVWMKISKDVAFDAEHISETQDVGHQRDHFASLSDDLYTLAKTRKPTQPVYYQHCPMANQGKGANWLSLESAIRNPYYGSQMLTCGKTTETIQ